MIRKTRRPRSIGVVVPAHDEERIIGECLRAIDRATLRVPDAVVHVIVACDACSDRTAEVTRALGHIAVRCDERNVGYARAAGARVALALGAQWLAFTDADTLVDEAWLSAQLELRSDVVCGTVGIDDWGDYGDALRVDFETSYCDRDGHRHVHGANLGISAGAYRRVGGFAALCNHEDVAIVHALEASGARIAWSAAPRVTTSARRDYRATAGFGHLLHTVATAIAEGVHGTQAAVSPAGLAGAT